MAQRKIKQLVLAACFGAFGASASFGQILHADGPLPSFEVATIKPWKPSPQPIGAPAIVKIDPTPRVRGQQTDRVHFIGQIGLLIMDAYNLPVGSEKRILTGPKWVESESDRYEVEAR